MHMVWVMSGRQAGLRDHRCGDDVHLLQMQWVKQDSQTNTRSIQHSAAEACLKLCAVLHAMRECATTFGTSNDACICDSVRCGRATTPCECSQARANI